METETIWKPHAVQEDFLSLPDSIFEVLYGGAAGGGKSEVLLMLPIVRKFYENPRWKGIILRRTYPELEQEVILRSRNFYPQSGATYKTDKKRWEWPWGSILQFGHAEYENDIRKYDTSEYNYVAFDEATSFTGFQYLYMTMSRCRSSTPELPAIVRAGTNPGNVGHQFFKNRFVDPCVSGRVVLVDKVTGAKRMYIPAKATDNPYLMANDPGYYDRLLALPSETERRAKREGDWFIFAGQVFSEWRDELLPNEPSNAVHVIDPFPIPDWWPRILAIDWGYAAMCWAGWAAIAPNRRVYLYREYAAKHEKVSTWATNIGRLSQGENLVYVALDPSAWGSRGEEKTIVEQFIECSGLNPAKADNDRIGGKLLVHEFLRWEPKPIATVPKNGYDPGVAVRLLRISGPVAYQNYLNLFAPTKVEDASILPRLQVFNTCNAFRNAIPLCIYDSDSSDGKKKEDVKEFDGDDPYDGGRYLLKAVDHYLSGAISEAKKREEVAKAMQYYESNPTQFYRMMDVIDRRQNCFGVRRFHRAHQVR